MTREEAIKIIDAGKKFAYDEKYVEAFNMAIKALEQEPCEDKIIDDHYWKGFHNGIRTEKFRESKREPCEDAVSRKAVLEMIEQIQDAGGFIGYNTYSEAFDVVDNMSPVAPTRKKGKWIEHIVRDDFDDAECVSYECNQCHSSYAEDDLNFWPNCGAEMESEDGSN